MQHIRTSSVLRTASPSRVAVDEKQITVDGEKKWLYAAIDTESKRLLEVDVFSRRGTDPASAFLHRLTEHHDVSDTEFLTDAGGYLTTLAGLGLRGGLNYSDRNLIEKWFQTVAMRIDRFHTFWRGSSASARRWLRRFRHITTTIGRTRRSMDERPPRRFSTRQYRRMSALNKLWEEQVGGLDGGIER